MYVVLDGFDLGVGALHLFLSPQRGGARAGDRPAIGPVWNGNEVWLLASGGVLFMAFPKAYAGAFSGLYFGLIIVLWLLVGRGLGLEFRHQLDKPAVASVRATPCSASPRPRWRSSSASRSATSCAAFRSARTATSRCRSSTS